MFFPLDFQVSKNEGFGRLTSVESVKSNEGKPGAALGTELIEKEVAETGSVGWHVYKYD